MKFLCDNCKAKYQIGDDKVAGKAVRMKCRRCGHDIHVSANLLEGAPSDADAATPEGSSPALAMAPAPAPAAPRYPGPIRSSGESHDDESTAIMALPMRMPAAARPSSAPTASPPGLTVGLRSAPPSSAPSPGRPGAAPGAANLSGLRPAAGGSASAPRPASVPRALGVTGVTGAPAARAPGAPRPASVPRAPLASVSGAALPGPAGALGHEPAGPAKAELRSPLEAGSAAPASSAKGTPPGLPSADSGPSPTDEWYVGISGVPLGPVQIAVIRDKALAGLIDGESLVWRDGFDAWKPLKNFPELLELVTSVQALRSSSAASASPASSSRPDPRPRSDPPPAAVAATGPNFASFALANAPAAVSPRAVASPPAFAPPAIAAERAAAISPIPNPTPHPEPFTAPPANSALFTAATPAPSVPVEGRLNSAQIPIDVLADPFGAAPAKPDLLAAPPPQGAPTSRLAPPAPESAAGLSAITKGASDLDLDEPVRVKRSHGTPALAYAFIAMAAVFGGVAAWVLFSKQPQQIIVVQQAPPGVSNGPTGSVPASALAPTAAPTGASTGQVEVGERAPEPTGAAPKPGPVASASGGLRPKATPTGTPAPFDTSGFFSTVPGPNANGPSASQGGSGQLSQGEIQGVVAQNQPLVRRKCWQPALDSRAAGGPSNARVTASIVIGASGNVDSASASGGEKDFPSLSGCIAGRVKSWKFPPSGGATPANIPFVFAGQ